MTSKSATTTSDEWECRKLQEFKEFLHSSPASPDTPGSNGIEMRQCMTRNNNETYPVATEEIQAEVLAALWNHLTVKRCPQDFQVQLLRAAIDEVESELKNVKTNNISSDASSDVTDNTTESFYDLIKLQKFALNNLEKLVTRLTDNAEATNLQKYATEGSLCAKGSQCTCPETTNVTQPHFLAAAVKNKPRKMEDRHCCLARFSDVYQLKSNNHKYSFYGVFDGHGGSLAATFATAQIPHLIAERLKQADSSTLERLQALREAFTKTDDLFTRKRISSGTTAVCVLHRQAVDSAELYVAWVGDSRAMLVSNQHTLKQLVHSHKPDCPEERKRIETNDSGAVMFVQGHWRVNGILNVSRSIGDFSVASVIAEPDTVAVDLTEKDDFLVIGTDGLWDYVHAEDVAVTIYESLAKGSNNLDDLPKLLIDLAKRGDSQDNITVVIVLLRDVEKIVESYLREKSEK